MQKTAIGILIIVGCYFGYIGLTTKPSEGDSLAYHLPIARIIAEGKTWEETAYTNVLYYYPATAEMILAGMMKVGLPLNLFNVIGWLLLLWGVYCWGKNRGLGRELATIMVMTVGMWMSVIRLLNNQTVDIWLAAWWVWLVVYLEKPKLNFLIVGLLMGPLIGTKYSGMGYLLVIGCFYAQRIIKQLSAKKFLVLGFGIVLGGGIWYIRNWLMTGNPVYPGGMFGWQGAENFRLQDWVPFKTMVFSPGGLRLLIEAFGSEYLFWMLLPAMALFVKKREMLLGWLNLGVFLMTPSWPINIVSDLRYTLVAMIPMLMAIFLWAKEKGKQEQLTIVCILGAAMVLTQLNYLPKLYTVVLALIAIWIWVGKK